MLYTHALGYFLSLNTMITPTEIPSVQDLLYRKTSSPSCLHSLKWNHVREQLDTFAAIASASKGGRIGIEEFSEYLKLPISDVLRELFHLFDRVSSLLPGWRFVGNVLLRTTSQRIFNPLHPA